MWLTLDRHLIVSWHSIGSLVDTWSISCLTVGQEWTNFWSMHKSRLILGWLSTGSWSSVDRVLTEYQSGCCLSINQDVDQGCWSRVSMDTRSWVCLLPDPYPIFVMPGIKSDGDVGNKCYLYVYMEWKRNFTLVHVCTWHQSVSAKCVMDLEKKVLDHWLFECSFTVPFN